VRSALEASGGVRLAMCWGGATLHHVDDLPFKLEALPTCYSAFRRAPHVCMPCQTRCGRG
jgi:hypothetical protein